MSGLGGFSQETLAFLAELELHNHKAWFDVNRSRFEAVVMEPARQFVEGVGAAVQAFAPEVHADPRTDKSIFRFHRDVRFSKDKAPFKTHLGILWWEGTRAKMGCSGFYFQLEANRAMLGAGLYMIPKELVGQYRDAVADVHGGRALLAAAAQVEAAGYKIEGRNAKRVPKGYPADLPQSDFLRHDGLYAWRAFDEVPAALFGDGAAAFAAEHFAAMEPLHRWLVDHV